MKDEQAGEVPVAFVVRSNGSTITEDEIKQFISKQVIQFFPFQPLCKFIKNCILSIDLKLNNNVLKILTYLGHAQVVFYKRINRVFFVDAIPKSPSGKILRKDLRARLAAGVPN